MSRRPSLRPLLAQLRPLRLQDGVARGSLVQGGVLSMIGLLSQGLLRFATSWLVGRVAGQVVLGTVQTAISTANLLALMGPTSTGSAASKYLARARGSGDEAELHGVAAHLGRRAVLLTGVLAVAGVLFWVLYDGGTWLDGVFVGLFTAAYSGYSFTRGVHFGTGQVVRATTWDAISAIGGVVALLVALALGARGAGLLLPLILSYAAYTVASWPRDVRRHAPLDPALRRELDHVILLGVTGTLASAGFLQIAMIVAKGTDPAGAGQFAAAMATATPASLLAISLSLVLFPSLAEAWGRGDHALFRAQTDQASRALMIVMVSIFGTLALCSRLVMGIIWGENFDADTVIFPLLVVAIMFTTVAVPSVNALTTRSRRLMQVTSGASFCGLLTGALAWWLLTPEFGAEGVAVGFLLGSMVSGSIPVASEWRVGRHHWLGLVLRMPLALALLAGLFFGLRALGLGPWWEPVAAAVFCLGWWGLCWRDLRLLPVPGLRRRPDRPDRPN